MNNFLGVQVSKSLCDSNHGCLKLLGANTLETLFKGLRLVYRHHDGIFILVVKKEALFYLQDILVLQPKDEVSLLFDFVTLFLVFSIKTYNFDCPFLVLVCWAGALVDYSKRPTTDLFIYGIIVDPFTLLDGTWLLLVESLILLDGTRLHYI